MDAEAQRLHRAIVDGFPTYLRNRSAELGADIDEAIGKATEWLDSALGALFALPPAQQDRSPLQVVREALAGPTAALSARGVPAVVRDDEQRRLLPEDRYALAPATARDLGEEAWRAHLAWGVAKAGAVAAVTPAGDSRPPGTARHPVLALVATDLMDRSKLGSIAERSGYSVVLARNPAAVTELLADRAPAAAFVDLTHAGADEAIRLFSAAGVRTVAFGPHVDDLAMARARSLGAAEAVPRSRFFRDPGRHLPPIV